MLVVLIIPIVSSNNCFSGCNTYMLGDGICQFDCFNQDCQYDYSDCEQTEYCLECDQFEQDEICESKCLDCEKDIQDCSEECSENCQKRMVNDGFCQFECKVETCEWDGDDCKENCNEGCYDWLKGDGNCDSVCDNNNCNYDDGDCKEKDFNLLMAIFLGIGLSLITAILVYFCALLAIYYRRRRRIAEYYRVENSYYLPEENNKRIEEVLKDVEFSDGLYSEKMCVICLEEEVVSSFEEKERLSELECEHIFHFECVVEWITERIESPVCPICKVKLFDN